MHIHRTGIGSGGNNRERATLLISGGLHASLEAFSVKVEPAPAGGPDSDFNVVAQRREELQEASCREISRAIPTGGAPGGDLCHKHR